MATGLNTDDEDATDRIAAPEHGGALAVISRAYPDAPRPWIDLSTGINPHPWPFPDPLPQIPDDALTRLPEPEAIAALERQAAQTYGASDPATVVAAPGTQILISLLPRIHPASTVAIVGPTYSEHTISWRTTGASVTTVEQLEACAGADVVVVVNPNNPDGRTVDPEQLLALAKTGPLVVVDEAFADLEDPALSCIPALPPSGMAVLRSFGKTYGLGGIRLGFTITGLTLADKIRAALGPWAVAGPALAVGPAALADTAWRKAAIRRLDEAVPRLDAAIRALGLDVVGGTRLFRLGTGADAPAVFDRLAQAGIVVRRFRDDSTLLRFGQPGGDDAWRRLEQAVRR
ncbi:MAG: threonine-phosphate decarboxylase CobD [Minwuiales bacterium]|nr:threonine-phosphate decarboxylase CobD [Minwuiales bacterium]